MASSSDEDITDQQPMTSYSSAVKVPSRATGTWNLAGYNKEILDRILSSIAVSPGQTAELSSKALKAFQWRIEANGTYVVALPTNLVDHQTNPLIQAAVASIYLLKARIVESTPAKIDTLEYLETMSEYIRGLAAALRIGGMGQKLVADSYSGNFHQGYRWAASEAMYAQHFPARAFRLDYKAPATCFPAKIFKPENQDAAMYLSWCTLVKEASKKLLLASPKSWAKGYQEIVTLHCKKAFQYESRAVFSADEVKSMTVYASTERERYNRFLQNLKEFDDEFILKFNDKYREVTNSLHRYDNTLSRIAGLRATLIYRESFKRKPDKGKTVPLTREDRVQKLDFYDWIVVTNPTGLFNDERVEFQVKVRRGTPDEEEAWGQFADWVMKLPRSTYMSNPLLYGWVAEVAAKATLLLEPDKPFPNPIDTGMESGRMDKELIQYGIDALGRIRLESMIESNPNN